MLCPDDRNLGYLPNRLHIGASFGAEEGSQAGRNPTRLVPACHLLPTGTLSACGFEPATPVRVLGDPVLRPDPASPPTRPLTSPQGLASFL